MRLGAGGWPSLIIFAACGASRRGVAAHHEASRSGWLSGWRAWRRWQLKAAFIFSGKVSALCITLSAGGVACLAASKVSFVSAYGQYQLAARSAARRRGIGVKQENEK